MRYTAMDKAPLYPVELPPQVAAERGFAHRVVSDTAREQARVAL